MAFRRLNLSKKAGKKKKIHGTICHRHDKLKTNKPLFLWFARFTVGWFERRYVRMAKCLCCLPVPFLGSPRGLSRFIPLLYLIDVLYNTYFMLRVSALQR